MGQKQRRQGKPEATRIIVLPHQLNVGIYTLAAVHRSNSPWFLFTTLNSSTPDVERFSQATRTPVLMTRVDCSLFTLFTIIDDGSEPACKLLVVNWLKVRTNQPQ